MHIEKNNSWYLQKPYSEHRVRGSSKWTKECSFESFDHFANLIFNDYTHQEYLFFPIGSQFLVSKKECIYYSKNFWKKLMNCLPKDSNLNGGPEAHVIGRSMGLIFSNQFKERN